MLVVIFCPSLFIYAGCGAPTNVEAWRNADVLEWASSFSFSKVNRLAILSFLREGITGKVLLVLPKRRLWNLSIGPATELILAIETLTRKAEKGTRDYSTV